MHGTGDAIIGDNWANDGFRYSIEYFLSQGYTKGQLYGSTWGWNDDYHRFQHQYQLEYVMYIRKFIEAVLDYTGAEEIDVVAHSMGVPLSRKALKGGWTKRAVWEGEQVPFYIGKPLTGRVRNYIGIVGPNFGVENCTHDLYQ